MASCIVIDTEVVIFERRGADDFGTIKHPEIYSGSCYIINLRILNREPAIHVARPQRNQYIGYVQNRITFIKYPNEC